jgi:hypothetical protein
MKDVVRTDAARRVANGRLIMEPSHDFQCHFHARDASRPQTRLAEA